MSKCNLNRNLQQKCNIFFLLQSFITTEEFDTSKSFFENITNNLESLIHPRNGTLSVDDQKKNMNDSLDISFASWENKNKQKYSVS